MVFYLEGLLQHIQSSPDMTGSERRLIVRRRTSLQDRLPEHYVEKVAKLPGVECATPMLWFGGLYRNAKPENMFGQLSCDPEVFQQLIPEAAPVDPVTGAPRPELYEEFRKDRAGAFAADELFKKFNWKLGDKITLIGTIYPINMELTLRAAYHAKQGTDNQTLYFHHRYVDELLGRPGLIGIVSARSKSIDDIPILIEKIDAKFANSEFETLTETERAFQAGFVQMLGNIKLFLRAIATAVAFAMLMVAANTTAMAARERAHEIAVMKAIGFTPGITLMLLLVEATLLCTLGASAGAFLAWLSQDAIEGMSKASFMSFFLAGYKLAPAIPFMGIAIGSVVGVTSSIIPCWQVARVPIVAGLRRTA